MNLGQYVMAVSRRHVESFATNLRIFCNKKSSIAEVCRETKIHRQQFNKYLAGNSFPNAHNLSVICKYLNVSAENLFLPAHSAGDPAHADSRFDLTTKRPNVRKHDDFLIPTQNVALEFSGKIMLEGSYYCYFPFPGHENVLIRSYLRVWNFEDRTQFSRLTRLCKPDDINSLIARGIHTGSVVRSLNELTLIGCNRRSPHQISIINLGRNPMLNGIYFGLAITRAADNSIACRAALEYLGQIKPSRSVVKSLGMILPNDNTVPKQIRLALIQHENLASQLIFAPSPDEILANLLT
jgi:transcriptional regulator with XRE-family HTH domain